MSSIGDLLLDFFLSSTDLVEADPNPKRSLVSSNNGIVKSMVRDDSYIPLLSVEKTKFIKNLSDVYPRLKEKADAVLKDLGVDAKLPPSYRVAIVTQLSIVETWRRVVTERLVFTKRVNIIRDKLSVSPYTLLLLYRFVVLSKFASTGKEMVDLFGEQLEDPRNKEILRDTYEEVRKILEYSASEDTKKNKGEQRRAYTMYNTLYAPLVFSYTLSGAGLFRYYNTKKRNQLAYTATALMDFLGSYSFRAIYGYSRPTLESMANELVQYFNVIYQVLSSRDFKSTLKEGSLYSFLVSIANSEGINDMSRISRLWDLVNNAVIAALVTLELCKEDECKDHADVLESYREKVGDISLYEYTTRQYGLAY